VAPSMDKDLLLVTEIFNGTMHFQFVQSDPRALSFLDHGLSRMLGMEILNLMLPDSSSSPTWPLEIRSLARSSQLTTSLPGF